MDKKYWLNEPEEHDFPAAQDYLELIMSAKDAKRIAELLKDAPTVQKKAKDILRASKLPLLTKSNIHVKQNLKKVKKGSRLSPVLLVRWNGLLIVADGYHRISTIYVLSEDLIIPCRIVDFDTKNK